jgi:hypothetical protein
MLFALLFSANAMATEEPKFETLERSGAFELRQYAPMIVAATGRAPPRAARRSR